MIDPKYVNMMMMVVMMVVTLEGMIAVQMS